MEHMICVLSHDVFCVSDNVGDRMDSLKAPSRGARSLGFSCGSHTPNRSLGVWDGARGFHADPTLQTVWCCIPSNSASCEQPAPRSRRTHVSNDSDVVKGLNCLTPGAGKVEAKACSSSPALQKAFSFVREQAFGVQTGLNCL